MFPTLMVAPLFIAILVADDLPMRELVLPPVLTRDEIKAARNRFDREMKLDTKRPWDVPQAPAADVMPAKPKPSED
jgi:hypothetical protein